MKKLILLLLIVVATSCKKIPNYKCYNGIVKEKYRTNLVFSTENHIIYYIDSFNKKYDIRLTNHEFINMNVGDTLCLEIYNLKH